MDRKRLGLWAVAFVLVVGVMEVLALKLGSLELPLPTGPERPTVADRPAQVGESPSQN
ncbi:hypothetical protein [Actinomadura sp. GC306]|uniref:hypothetical protein n=1 Tax=Actinomadura sp. GC306 TaxID=2530367 RepID=UPI001404B623|nr:hypothetical protein [Actinomadura sp. GC306]